MVCTSWQGLCTPDVQDRSKTTNVQGRLSPSDGRGAVHVAQLRAQGQVEGVHVVAAVGLQQTRHAEQQQESGLERQRRPHYSPHPPTAPTTHTTPTSITPTQGTVTSALQAACPGTLRVLGPAASPGKGNHGSEACSMTTRCQSSDHYIKGYTLNCFILRIANCLLTHSI